MIGKNFIIVELSRGLVDITKTAFGLISESHQKNAIHEKEKSEIYKDAFEHQKQKTEDYREEVKNLNIEVKDGLKEQLSQIEKNKENESRLIGQIIEIREEEFRNYAFMMKCSHQKDVQLFNSHMSRMNEFLMSVQSSMSKSGEIVSNAYDHIKKSFQNEIEHAISTREKIKNIEEELVKDIAILKSKIEDLANSTEIKSEIRNFLDDKGVPEKNKEKLKLILEEISLVEKINEKEIDLIGKEKDREIVQEQLRLIDKHVYYIKEKNIEALASARECMFAAIKINDLALKNKNFSVEIEYDYNHFLESEKDSLPVSKSQKNNDFIGG